MITRKNIRLQDYDYSRDGDYFVTICTDKRRHYFWDYSKPVGGDAHIAPSHNNINYISTPIPFELTDIGTVVEKYILNINGILKYVIMPNHVHMIIRIENDTNGGAMRASPPTQSLPKMIRSFKIVVSKELGFSPWQRNYYEHIIRNSKDYSQIWQYIETNPANWEDDELFINENNIKEK
ncbi:MAG TPA: hypothetical protein PLH98_04490 [Ruminococcus flavefaciens]|nr:hypothetical protein [Ruminococcus flavefaciens]HQL99804.1 hypothetical protein [Ruminococcus flavefaciens]